MVAQTSNVTTSGLEYSDLSGIFIEDGLAVNVRIYKKPSSIGWFLEAQDDSNQPVIWSKRFPSDRAAWDEFLRVVNSETMEGVVGSMKIESR